ncbi:phage tail protein, partial [Salmonella enterica]|nr:phage tail protein [Salmonella enterica]
IIHDWMYDNALRTKKEADKIFLDGMTVLGVPKWKRTVMYWAVRWFGRGMYRDSR